MPPCRAIQASAERLSNDVPRRHIFVAGYDCVDIVLESKAKHDVWKQFQYYSS
jgi:hypothetical protein